MATTTTTTRTMVQGRKKRTKKNCEVKIKGKAEVSSTFPDTKEK